MPAYRAEHSARGLEVPQFVVPRPRDHEQKMDKEHGKCDFFGKYIRITLEDELPSVGCTLQAGGPRGETGTSSFGMQVV
jgi:hypothetical protein